MIAVIDIISVRFVKFLLVNNVIDTVTADEEGGEQVTNDTDVVVHHTLGYHLTVREAETPFQEPLLLTSFLDGTGTLELVFSQRWFVRLYDGWYGHQVVTVVGSVGNFTVGASQAGGSWTYVVTDSLEESAVTVMDVRPDLASEGSLLIMRVERSAKI